jgi:hypothetical protein
MHTLTLPLPRTPYILLSVTQVRVEKRECEEFALPAALP